MAEHKQYKDLQTRVLQTHSKHGEPLYAHTFPIFQTSTYLFEDTTMGADLFSGKREGHMYSRMGNPTTEYFEQLVCELEEGAGTAAFGAGMGAIHASTVGLLKAGDHMISGDTLYGCSIELFGERLKHMGIEVTFVNTGDKNEVAKAWKENTKLVYLESPANPTGKVSDIRGIAEYAHERGALMVVDCTFTTPIFIQGLKLGADVVVHSITKYINGHGDVVGGVATAKTAELINKIKGFRKDTGSLMAPMDAFLCVRGIKTLPMRMERHMQNGLKVAEFLEKHEKIVKVNHPGLPSFEGYELAKSQQSGYGATFSFIMKSFEAAKTLMEKVKLCSLAVSLGTLDTLIEHPASMTHAAVPEDLLKQQGLTRELVRISVGLENADDIIEDLRQALEQC